MTTSGLSPHDFALLLLAAESGPPRQRARDQRADRTGLELRRQVLQRLAALDPDAEQLEAALLQIVSAIGPPTGPARSVAISVRDEWRAARDDPGVFQRLLQQALQQGTARDGK